MITNADQGILLTWNGGPGMATITGGSATVVNAPQTPGGSGVIPVLQAQDGSFIGAAPDPNAYNRNDMVSFDAAGNVRWIVPNEQPQIATDDGGVIGQSGIAYDSGGNATGQVSLYTQSWGGNEYTASDSVAAIAAPPVAPDSGSFWPEAGGNPSGNEAAVAQCPCLLQSAAAATATPSFDTAISEPAKRADLPPPAGPPSPKTYVILEGDPGLNFGYGRNHNVGGLFDLAAGTQQDALNAQGNLAYPPIRVSSVQDFEAQLTGNGPITGGVIYFGHGDKASFFSSGASSQLYPGEQAGVNTNITGNNADLLKNTQLGSGATITLHACFGGFGKQYSLAQLIANLLQRKVYASEVGTFFSPDPQATFPRALPNTLPKPVYQVQEGGGPMTCFLPSLRPANMKCP
jgi:hypothetical protein